MGRREIDVPAFVEGLPIALFVIDVDGRPTYANAAARSLLGAPTDGAWPDSAFPAVYPAFVAGTQEPYPDARRPILRALAGETCMVEDMEIHRDGAAVRVQAWASPIVDDAGQVCGAVSAFTDITHRKTVEESSEESARQLREAQSVARMGSWNWDIAANTVTWSEELSHIFGLQPRPHPVTYERFLEWIHPYDRQMVDAAVGTSLATGQPLSFTQRIVLPEGEPIWLQTRGRVVTGPDGPERLVGTCQDITELAVAQAVLRDSERQLREAQSVARVGSWTWDLDSGAVSWSDQLYRVYGLQPVGCPISYQSFVQLIHPDDRGRALGLIQEAIRTGGSFSFDHRVVRPDGARTWVHCRGRTVATTDGHKRMVGTAQDVTERKEAEQEVRASRTRIVRAADEARRRLERDLHDGAQQRLIAASLTLRSAEQRLRTSNDQDPAVAALLAEAAEELQLTLAELRELARGLHPALLTEEGLGAALESLAERASVPVSLVAAPDRRLPSAVEAAAYFVVSEALANVGKHADASKAMIGAWLDDGVLIVEASDDGVGGAQPANGSGLAGLSDRMSALDGALRLDSPLGVGTRVRAEIPVSSEVMECG